MGNDRVNSLRNSGWFSAELVENMKRCAQHSAWYRVNMAYGERWHSDAENDRKDVIKYCGPILRNTRGYSTSTMAHMSATAGIASLTWDVSPNITTDNIAN